MAVMDTFFDRERVDRITVEARDVELGRAVLTAVAAVLFGIGWLAAKVVGVVWLTIAWSWTAVRLGWTEARGQKPARAQI
jgi:hypothetical protein